MNRAASVLIVDDAPAEAMLTREGFKEAGIDAELHGETSAREALDYLAKIAEDPTQVPDLILLDINLPGPSGYDVLRFVKEDTRLARIPVIMFSSSESRSDVVRAEALNADGYIGKPADFSGYVEVARLLESYLPHR
ncbi:MAG: response regulator [Planctomycetes bacterium]|nr:response regulator [Planctomycetota bacterium]